MPWNSKYHETWSVALSHDVTAFALDRDHAYTVRPAQPACHDVKSRRTLHHVYLRFPESPQL
jgi:hypothetical protein